MWGVVGDLDLADLDDDVTPENLVHMIVEWVPIDEMDTHTDDDGEEHVHHEPVWFPVLLGPCGTGGSGHAPGMLYVGPVHVSVSYRDALRYAKKSLKRLREIQSEMMNGLEQLTAEAAAEALEKEA